MDSRGIPLVLTTNASKISRHSPPMNRKRRAPDFLISSLKSETSLLEAYDSFSSECFNGVFSRREYFGPGQNISTININSDEHVSSKNRKITPTKSSRKEYVVKKTTASLPSTPQLLSPQEYPQPYLQNQTQPYLQTYPQPYAQPYPPPPPYPIMFANPHLYNPYQISQHGPSGVPPLIYYADTTQNSAPMTFMPVQPQRCVENTSVPSINSIPVLPDKSIIPPPSSMVLDEPIKSKEDTIPFKENITQQQQTIVHEQHSDPSPLVIQEQNETCLTEKTLDPSNKENLSKHILTETSPLSKQGSAPLNNENTDPIKETDPAQHQQSTKKNTTGKRVTRQRSETTRKVVTTESLEGVKRESRYPERRTRAQAAAMAAAMAAKDTSLVAVNTRKTRSSKEECLDIPKAKVTRAATSKKLKVPKVPKSAKVTKATVTTRASRSRKPVTAELEESKSKDMLDMVKPEDPSVMEPKTDNLKMEESTVDSLQPEAPFGMEPKAEVSKMEESTVDSLQPEAPFGMEPKAEVSKMEDLVVDSLQPEALSVMKTKTDDLEMEESTVDSLQPEAPFVMKTKTDDLEMEESTVDSLQPEAPFGMEPKAEVSKMEDLVVDSLQPEALSVMKTKTDDLEMEESTVDSLQPEALFVMKTKTDDLEMEESTVDSLQPEVSFGMESKEEVLKMKESTVDSLQPEALSVMKTKTDDLEMEESTVDSLQPEVSFGMESKEEVLKMKESTVDSLQPEAPFGMEPKAEVSKMEDLVVDSLQPEDPSVMEIEESTVDSLKPDIPFAIEGKSEDPMMEEPMVDSLQLKKEEPLEAAESSDEKNTNSEPNKKETNALKSDVSKSELGIEPMPELKVETMVEIETEENTNEFSVNVLQPKAIETMSNDFKREQEIELLKENVQVEATINVVSKKSQEDTNVVLGDTEKVMEPVSDDAKEPELKDNMLEPSFESPNEYIADDNASGEDAAKTKFEDETVFMESLLSDEMALSALDDPFPLNFNEENIIDDTADRLSQNNGISTGNLVTDRSYEQLQQKYGGKQNKKAAEGSNSQEECTFDRPKAVQTKEENVDLDSERIKRIQSEIDLINLQFPDLKNSFTLLDRVGRGTFSKVYKALDLFYSKSIPTHPQDKLDDPSDSRNELVAIKLIHGISSPRRVANEIKCLAELRGSQSITPMITAFRNEDVTYLVLPYIEFDHFEDIYSTMCLLDLKHYISQLFIGLKGVHAKGIIHRDIKPGNFMYNNRTKIGYLGDFGLAQRTTHLEVHRPGQLTAKMDPSYSLPEDGPPGYIMNDTRRPIQVDRSGTRSFRAPEIYLNSPRQTTAMDIWAVGVILLSFLTNIYPYFDAEDSAAGIVELMTTFGTKQVSSFANFYGKICKQ
ncbi:unnamed protein product [Rhizopus stolonifer]